MREYNTLTYILNKYNLNPEQRPPIDILDMNRVDLAMLFAELDFLKGVEVGVEQGVYAEALCKANPDALIYGVDPWQAYKGYREHVSQNKLNTFYEETKERMKNYNWIPIRAFSVEASTGFDDESLDFVYIDGNHDFLNVATDLTVWSKKVRKGGIISGHDFKRSRGSYICHVKDVVQAWAYSHHIRPWFVLRNDNSPSWFWVN